MAYQLVLLAADIRHVHVMGGRTELLQLLPGEDVEGRQMDLGVSVLARLGRAHVDDLAGTVFDHDMATLAEGRALHRVRARRPSIGRVEGMLMLWFMIRVSRLPLHPRRKEP